MHFAFVSCQNDQLGACNAYRRMIWEDERRAGGRATAASCCTSATSSTSSSGIRRIGRRGYYARRIRDIVRYPNGREARRLSRADRRRRLSRAVSRVSRRSRSAGCARALAVRLHVGQPRVLVEGLAEPAEFRTGRIRRRRGKSRRRRRGGSINPRAWSRRASAASTTSLRRALRTLPLRNLDDNGLGEDRDNLAAIRALTLYRTLRHGANLELILTDNRSYRSEPVNDRAEMKPFRLKGFPYFVLDDAFGALDAGRTYERRPSARRPSSSTARDCRIRMRTLRRARYSAQNRRLGFWSGCAHREHALEDLGKLGRDRSTGAPICRTCRRQADRHGRRRATA